MLVDENYYVFAIAQFIILRDIHIVISENLIFLIFTF